jgi:predicted Zn-dependent protease
MNRREKLEALLADSPDDTFLQYALAMELASGGDEPAAIRRLQALLDADAHYVPAWFQLGQLFARTGAIDESRRTLVRGIEIARRAGDAHAEGEMRGFLEGLPG